VAEAPSWGGFRTVVVWGEASDVEFMDVWDWFHREALQLFPELDHDRVGSTGDSSGDGRGGGGGGGGKPQTPDKWLDCEKLKKLGISKTSLNRMKSTMASANYGANLLEVGYSYYSGGYADGLPGTSTDGRPYIKLPIPYKPYRGIPGHTFHVHPSDGWSPWPSREDKAMAKDWYGGQHFVGSSQYLIHYNSKKTNGTILGVGNWWEVDCP